MRELHNQIVDFLTVKAKEQWDYDWVVEFSYWDKGDCSTGGLINCLQLYNFENTTRDIYGNRGDILDSTRHIAKVMERMV